MTAYHFALESTMETLFEFSKMNQMSTIRADYAITGVHHEGVGIHRRIVSVEVKANIGTTLGIPNIWRRQEVVRQINSGTLFMTYTWQWGAKVEVVTINGVEYLRTDRNQTPLDNLGNLPEF